MSATDRHIGKIFAHCYPSNFLRRVAFEELGKRSIEDIFVAILEIPDVERISIEFDECLERKRCSCAGKVVAARFMAYV